MWLLALPLRWMWRKVVGIIVLIALLVVGLFYAGRHLGWLPEGWPAGLGNESASEPPSASSCSTNSSPLTDAGFQPAVLERAQAAVSWVVDQHTAPGAVLALGRGHQQALEQGFGYTDWTAAHQADPRETMYDLASLTKPVATTAATMLLYEAGKLRLDQQLGELLPQTQGTDKASITIQQLLTHTSGLPLNETTGPTPTETLAKILQLPRTPPGPVRYSNLNMVLLWAVGERLVEPAGLEPMLQERVFRPLGMCRTSFRPALPCSACAPTTPHLQGVVHDETARSLGGLTGCAGLFSTAHDLGRFAAMMAGEGELAGVRIFRDETVRLFTQDQPATDRTLGWQQWDNDAEGSYGHTVFTGTSIWIDPASKSWVVILSNRTYQPQLPDKQQTINLNGARHSTAQWAARNTVG